MSLLEKHMEQHLRMWWKVATLEHYAKKKMIPRGLRLKKNTTCTALSDFVTKWNEILTDCSLKLIQLLITNEQEKITEMNHKNEETKNTLGAYSSNTQYGELQTILNKNLEQYENALMKTKKS